ENLTDYAVIVHGIKGSSFGIGAIRAGEDAQRLERMARAGKADEVLAENDAFVKYMENFLDSLDGTLEIIKAKNRKPVASAPDPALLRDLRSACMEYDVGKVDKIMAALESFEYANGAHIVHWLQEQVDEMSFREISEGKWPAA
ncbi:MAG: histidine kinase, partial [Treponema sp.]|nr:histidine kinase [Treponema sp.]